MGRAAAQTFGRCDGIDAFDLAPAKTFLQPHGSCQGVCALVQAALSWASPLCPSKAVRARPSELRADDPREGLVLGAWFWPLAVMSVSFLSREQRNHSGELRRCAREGTGFSKNFCRSSSWSPLRGSAGPPLCTRTHEAAGRVDTWRSLGECTSKSQQPLRRGGSPFSVPPS